jgi:TonB family protein
MTLIIKYLFILFPLFSCTSVVGQNNHDYKIFSDSTALAEFIYNHIHYPLIDYIRGVEGTAIYQIETDSEGRIEKLQLDGTSGSSSLDREARRLIYEIPMDNRTTDTIFSVSIGFKLEDNKIYTQGEIEEQPEFPGGNTEILKFISQNLHWPPEGAEMGIQGSILCGFIIEKDGSINTVEVLRPLDRFFDAEALRVIGRMPKWKAAKKNGKFVRVYYILPVKIHLQ